MTPKKRPPIPQGLARTPGGRLWRDVVKVYELRVDELVVLEAACRTLNDADKLAKGLRGQRLVTAGSKGQERAHPLLLELRQARALLAQLLRQLGLPDEVRGDTADARASERTWSARKAARARWS